MIKNTNNVKKDERYKNEFVCEVPTWYELRSLSATCILLFLCRNLIRKVKFNVKHPLDTFLIPHFIKMINTIVWKFLHNLSQVLVSFLQQLNFDCHKKQLACRDYSSHLYLQQQHSYSAVAICMQKLHRLQSLCKFYHLSNSYRKIHVNPRIWILQEQMTKGFNMN